jgi:hypothetical protein
MREQRFNDRITASICGGGNGRDSAASGEFGVGTAFDKPLRDR